MVQRGGSLQSGSSVPSGTAPAPLPRRYVPADAVLGRYLRLLADPSPRDPKSGGRVARRGLTSDPSRPVRAPRLARAGRQFLARARGPDFWPRSVCESPARGSGAHGTPLLAAARSVLPALRLRRGLGRAGAGAREEGGRREAEPGAERSRREGREGRGGATGPTGDLLPLHPPEKNSPRIGALGGFRRRLRRMRPGVWSPRPASLVLQVQRALPGESKPPSASRRPKDPSSLRLRFPASQIGGKPPASRCRGRNLGLLGAAWRRVTPRVHAWVSDPSGLRTRVPRMTPSTARGDVRGLVSAFKRPAALPAVARPRRGRQTCPSKPPRRPLGLPTWPP